MNGIQLQIGLRDVQTGRSRSNEFYFASDPLRVGDIGASLSSGQQESRYDSSLG
jgi:hypothetical protein